MKPSAAWAALALVVTMTAASEAHAWGGLGHRTIAAIAAKVMPRAKMAKINVIMRQLEIDNDLVDGASYPDEFIRDHDPERRFNPWHYADLPDDGSAFDCARARCLFDALSSNLAIVRQGRGDYREAVALAWVIHLVGDLYQPLHMSGRARGGNDFHVAYRGRQTCRTFNGGTTRVELHSVWDDCLVDELAAGRSPDQLANALLRGSPPPVVSARRDPAPWLAAGRRSHDLANAVAFDGLRDGDDLGDAYIAAPGKARGTVRRQLLASGELLARLLDRNVR
jgi:hypothetical protein